MGLLISCQPNQSEKQVTGTPAETNNADIIRNPVSIDGEVDTVNVARLTFDEPNYQFGEVASGEVVEHVYKFRNTGTVPLVISDARSTCGCTVPEWPRQAIYPGDEGEIQVRFDTKGKAGNQGKPVTITANTYPPTTQISLSGYVRPKNEGSLSNAKND